MVCLWTILQEARDRTRAGRDAAEADRCSRVTAPAKLAEGSLRIWILVVNAYAPRARRRNVWCVNTVGYAGLVDPNIDSSRSGMDQVDLLVMCRVQGVSWIFCPGGPAPGRHGAAPRRARRRREPRASKSLAARPPHATTLASGSASSRGCSRSPRPTASS